MGSIQTVFDHDDKPDPMVQRLFALENPLRFEARMPIEGRRANFDAWINQA